VMVPGALVFFADPHAVISDGIISGTGVECTAQVRACISVRKGMGALIDRPIIEVDDTLQVLGFGPTVEEATQDAARAAVGFVSERSSLTREEAYMLLSIIGELRIGTSPRPIMAARLIIPRKTLEEAGYKNGQE
jgi:amidase